VTAAPDLELLAKIPRDAEGPVFREPWEAQAFAMAVKLHEAGLFTWTEWARALAEEIKGAQAKGDPDLGNTDYRHWLAALERLIAEKGVAMAQEIDARAAALTAPHAAHDHDHDHD